MFFNGHKKTVAIKMAAHYEIDCPANAVFYPQRFCQRFRAGKDQFAGKKDSN
jgi:hypothetical protein